MKLYTNETEYLAELKRRTMLPRGFRAGSTALTFYPAERPVGKPLPMRISALLLDEPTPSFAGVFTRNLFPGAPVLLGRGRLSRPVASGVIVNNKVANVCAGRGVEDAEELLSAFGALSGYDPAALFSASTGVVGWRLPLEEMKTALPALAASLHDGDALDVARGIMTTDSFPKARSIEAGGGRILAIAKGAGMIEPNMATMLVFILTDIDVPREELRETLAEVAGLTFNRISVDGDQSTSDTALVFSSRKVRPIGKEAFRDALLAVCGPLAEDIVRNGEGTAHVIEVTVTGAASEEIALGAGKAVVNSPLVKTAIFGNDPNVGRIIAALGDYMGNAGHALEIGALEASIGGRTIFQGGRFRLTPETEAALSEYLRDAALDPSVKGYPVHEKKVEIRLALGGGSAEARVIGADLSYDYVKENADYRT
jgi:glutamate N-acetyltransferase/amino-acid N-acetyltransferase